MTQSSWEIIVRMPAMVLAVPLPVHSIWPECFGWVTMMYDCGALTFIAVASLRLPLGGRAALAVMLCSWSWHIAEFGGGIGTGDFR